MEKSLLEEDIIDLLSVIRDTLNLHLYDQLKVYYVLPFHIHSYHAEGVVLESQKFPYIPYNTLDGDYGLLTIKKEKLNLYMSLYHMYTGLSGDIYNDKPYIEEITENFITIGNIGIREIERRIKEDLPKELYLEDGRYTLRLDFVRLSLGPSFDHSIPIIKEHNKKFPEYRGLRLEIQYDIVDEDEYVIEGEKYKEGRSRFEDLKRPT